MFNSLTHGRTEAGFETMGRSLIETVCDPRVTLRMPTFGQCLAVISSAPVVLWSNSDCADSSSVKRLLQSYSITPLVVELDQNLQGPDLKIDLTVLTGQEKIPSLWIDGHYVGGHVEVWYLHSVGLLRGKLEEAMQKEKEKQKESKKKEK